MMKKSNTRQLVTAALCLALGLVLPKLFHLLGAGSVFLPMHIPVLLCGFLCGWKYGALVGLVTPLCSSLLTGMPPLFPTAVAMMCELCAYGLVTGLLYPRRNVYIALVAAMLAGRALSGAVNAVLLGVSGASYGLEAFISASFVTALPGILIQLIALPLLVLALARAGLAPRRAHAGAKA